MQVHENEIVSTARQARGVVGSKKKNKKTIPAGKMNATLKIAITASSFGYNKKN